LILLPACSAKKRYPDPAPGSHTADYRVLFGRLQRVPPKNPDAAPNWVIRYGFNDADKYAGKFNLTPPERLIGFSGGEQVQITGSIRPEMTNPDIGGTWYQVDTIRLWSSTKPE
ncbi:MAG: hypothetical protein WCI73_09055, partial [Phycisphaerae bacterium]